MQFSFDSLWMAIYVTGFFFRNCFVCLKSVEHFKKPKHEGIQGTMFYDYRILSGVCLDHRHFMMWGFPQRRPPAGSGSLRPSAGWKTTERRMLGERTPIDGQQNAKVLTRELVVWTILNPHLSQTLHVWYIYLHWGGFGGQGRHIWQSHGVSGYWKAHHCQQVRATANSSGSEQIMASHPPQRMVSWKKFSAVLGRMISIGMSCAMLTSNTFKVDVMMGSDPFQLMYIYRQSLCILLSRQYSYKE